MTVEQETVITNNKEMDVKLSLFEQLPKSNTSNIKVKLLNPENTNDGGPVKLTPANNLHWTHNLKSKEKITIPFVYTIEWSGSHDICIS